MTAMGSETLAPWSSRELSVFRTLHIKTPESESELLSNKLLQTAPFRRRFVDCSKTLPR